jgi:SAM-dependent methyltransferase
MALSCPIDFPVDQLRERVRAMYDRLARSPTDEFHFHNGAEYAIDRLGYVADEIRALPAASTARFAGVGNPLRIGPLHAGETVLDHACGAGTDLLLAAAQVGPTGQAIGVDMTPAMQAQATASAQAAGMAGWVSVRAGLFEDLPVDSASVDVVISNGVVNLAPDKRRVFSEIARVLRPGGRLYLADVVVARELSLRTRQDPELWAACIGGALREDELVGLGAEVGLADGRITERFDCFAGTSAGAKVAQDLLVQGANFFARKPM